MPDYEPEYDIAMTLPDQFPNNRLCDKTWDVSEILEAAGFKVYGRTLWVNEAREGRRQVFLRFDIAATSSRKPPPG